MHNYVYLYIYIYVYMQKISGYLGLFGEFAHGRFGTFHEICGSLWYTFTECEVMERSTILFIGKSTVMFGHFQ